MKFVTIDIETTSLDIETCNILQFAAVFYDLENPIPVEDAPKLNIYIDNSDNITGNIESILMNVHTLEVISKLRNCSFKPIDGILYNALDVDKFIELFKMTNHIYSYISPEYFFTTFSHWLGLCYGTHNISELIKKEYFNFAGKNINSFDLPICKRVFEKFNNINISHRVLDPGILFMKYDDKRVPNMNECLRRAGIQKKTTHNAVDDCLDVIRLIKHHCHME